MFEFVKNFKNTYNINLSLDGLSLKTNDYTNLFFSWIRLIKTKTVALMPSFGDLSETHFFLLQI